MQRSKLLRMGTHEAIVKRCKSSKIIPVVICMFALLLLAHAEAVSAATYYVSPTGSDSNNGSMATPFRSIQKAANIVNAGDTVIVKDGTYTGGSSTIVNLARGGTSGSWITFRSENKWGAVLDGQNNTTGYCWNFSTGANYVRVEDFEVKGCNYGAFWSNETTNNNYIYGNKIHHIHYGVVDPYAYDTSGKVGAYQGANISGYTYDSNIFYTIGRSPNTPPISNDYGHDHGLYIFGTNTTIINNIFYDLKAGFGIQVAPTSSGTNIVNNTFIGPNPGLGGGGIMLWEGGTIHIEDNIFASYSSYAVTCGDYYPTGVLAYNNLTSPGVALLQDKCSGKDITKSGNLEGQDPKFVDSSNHDYHLQSNSPAIDKGIVAGVSTDADGNLRTGLPDLGAYEYVSGTVAPPPVVTVAPDTTPPSTPAGLAAAAISSSQVNLAWTASTDNVGIAGYRVYRNGTQVATPAGTSYGDAGLSPSTAYTYTVSAYDAAGNGSPQSGPVSATTQGITQSPYPGPNPASVPGIIEAENFDNGGEGVAYHDTTSTNLGGAYRQTGVDIEPCSEGGYDVGWIDAGEWMAYTINVAVAGTYDIQARVAADTGHGGTFHIEFNGVNKTGTMTVSSTGGWQSWATVTKSGVSLPAGKQVVKFVFDTQVGWGISLNYIKISSSSPAPTGDTTPPSTPAGLKARTASSTQINLAWTASTDNVGVTGYSVYRNGVQVATSAGTSYADTGLSPSTTYTYTVSAYDAAGDASPKSAPVSATTWRRR